MLNVKPAPLRAAPMRRNLRAMKNPAPAAAGERIAKRLARAGLCSRREAEAWILAGRVAVDGKTLDSPAFNVTAASQITVDRHPIPETQPTRLWRYHKPVGVMTTTRDPQGRPTIFDDLPRSLPRVVTIGRLDFNSEGLLLLTNDGELARRLELPATGWARRYRVRVLGQVNPARLAALAGGLEIAGVRYGPIRAQLDRQLASNAWLSISLAEGKNREVRRICEHFGWPVQRLIRVAFGPFQLGNLPAGAVDEVPAKALAEQLGGKEAKRASRAKESSTPSPALPHQGGGGSKSGGGKKKEKIKRKRNPSPLVGEGREGRTPTKGGDVNKTRRKPPTRKPKPRANRRR